MYRVFISISITLSRNIVLPLAHIQSSVLQQRDLLTVSKYSFDNLFKREIFCILTSHFLAKLHNAQLRAGPFCEEFLLPAGVSFPKYQNMFARLALQSVQSRHWLRSAVGLCAVQWQSKTPQRASFTMLYLEVYKKLDCTITQQRQGSAQEHYIHLAYTFIHRCTPKRLIAVQYLFTVKKSLVNI